MNIGVPLIILGIVIIVLSVGAYLAYGQPSTLGKCFYFAYYNGDIEPNEKPIREWYFLGIHEVKWCDPDT